MPTDDREECLKSLLDRAHEVLCATHDALESAGAVARAHGNALDPAMDAALHAAHLAHDLHDAAHVACELLSTPTRSYDHDSKMGLPMGSGECGRGSRGHRWFAPPTLPGEGCIVEDSHG